MAVLASVLTVLFVIMSIILVILILLQSDKGSGMGIIGGSSNSAFGSSTADVVTKITGVLVALFMVGSLGLSVLESSRGSAAKRLAEESKKKNATLTEENNSSNNSASKKSEVGDKKNSSEK